MDRRTDLKDCNSEINFNNYKTKKFPKICYSKKSFTFVLGQSSDNFTVKALNVT